MFSSRSIGQKISRQGQKDVTSRIVPTNLQKFLIIFYSLLKMTQGYYPQASEPEPTRTPIKSIFNNRSNYTQCFNILPSHQFALVIRLFQTNSWHSTLSGKNNQRGHRTDFNSPSVTSHCWQNIRIQNCCFSPFRYIHYAASPGKETHNSARPTQHPSIY